MTLETQLWTIERFFAEGPNEPCELVEGRIDFVSPGMGAHSQAQSWTMYHLMAFVDQNSIGQAFTELAVVTGRDPDTVRYPDVAVLSFDRWSGDLPSTFAPVCPEIMIEIVSPSNTAVELRGKAAEYFAAGAEQVWIEDPLPRSIRVEFASGRVVTFNEDNILLGEGILEGFSLPVVDFFRRRPR